ncbi:MAG: aminoglycoside phosphotransferase family protein [Melioribacteraceae bacterium]|nr:aminoglycoside phosphotransferase family protein [Melioribacteraceae bacterium]
MIEKIISNFRICGDFIEAKPFGNGHINDTFLVSYNQAGIEVKYILRKINKYVFKNPEVVIQNTVNVISHITEKLKAEGVKEISNYVIQLVKSKNNNFHYIDDNKDYWCAVFFIENTYTVESVRTEEQAYQAAKAFGRFQKLLIDAELNQYKDTIPNFHNLDSRLIVFDKALEKDEVGRAKKIEEELEKAKLYRNISKKITDLIKGNELPIRITHNDTKINNVMLNKETNNGQCVIDLDTVMPGTVLYDFGDMVRTSTSPVEEDEKDISKVTMRINIFEALVKGYLEELSDVLTELEITNLIYGVKVIVYEQAIRFLTDYIMNDVYYNINYSEHNLVRARTQIALLESIEEQTEAMEKIVKKYAYFNN